MANILPLNFFDEHIIHRLFNDVENQILRELAPLNELFELFAAEFDRAARRLSQQSQRLLHHVEGKHGFLLVKYILGRTGHFLARDRSNLQAIRSEGFIILYYKI